MIPAMLAILAVLAMMVLAVHRAAVALERIADVAEEQARADGAREVARKAAHAKGDRP